jgi:hypothetical protein
MLVLPDAGQSHLKKKHRMSTKHAFTLFIAALFAVILSQISPAEAVSIDGTTVPNGNGFKCIFLFKYVPATEDVGGIQIDITTNQNQIPAEIITSAPEQGPWSQISPVLVRKDPSISLSAITPSFLKSTINDPVPMFTLQFTYAGNPPSDIRKLIDTIMVKNVISTSGKSNTVTMSWGETSIKGRKDLSHPECRYIAKTHRVHQLTFSLKNESIVKARVIDVNGKTVSVLLNSKLPSGIHTVAWDGTSGAHTVAASGIYFIQLETGSFTYNKKVSYLK